MDAPEAGAAAGNTDRLGDGLVAADFGRNPAAGRRGDLVITSVGTVNDSPPKPAYLLYGGTGGLGQTQVLEAGSGAAADFNSLATGTGYADLAGLATGPTPGYEPTAVQVFSGGAGG